MDGKYFLKGFSHCKHHNAAHLDKLSLNHLGTDVIFYPKLNELSFDEIECVVEIIYVIKYLNDSDHEWYLLYLG